MTRFLKISNSGLVDSQALHLIGASTKREDDSKIGFFGSGFKYALATLARLDALPRIFSGENEIEISFVWQEFRGQTFKVFVIDGARTSITTETGPKWQPWEAIRDIWANAIDEGGEEKEVSTASPSGTPNRTSIWIPITKEIEEVLTNWDLHFISGRKVLHPASGVYNISVLEKGVKTYLGHRGFSVLKTGHKTSVFSYENNDQSDLNENRTIDLWQFGYEFRRSLLQDFPAETIRKILPVLADPQFIESALFKVSNSISFFGGYWKEAIEGFTFCPASASRLLEPHEEEVATIIPDDLFQALQDAFPIESAIGASKKGGYKIRPTSPEELETIERAKKYCSSILPISFPVHVARMASLRTLGLADMNNGQIIISESIAENLPTLIPTLLEEQIHLQFKVHDETRQMQDTLLRLLVSTIKKDLTDV